MNRAHLAAFTLLTWIVPHPTHAADPAAPVTNSWHANPTVVAKAAKRKSFNFEESNVPVYTLPDPLVAADGTPVTSDTWPARRAEILELFQSQVYGRPPAGDPQNISFKVIEHDSHDDLVDRRAARWLVEISFDTPHAGRFMFRTQLFIPNEVRRPVPAIVLLNFQDLFNPMVKLIVNRGVAVAVLDRTLIAADDKDTYRDLLINAFHGDGPLAPDDGRAIAAWAWAASRVLDFLLTNPDIDPNRIGVAGHSRMGKTALWAAASDPRFAVAHSNESGCGGAALSRRKLGETVARINTSFPHWFCENFRQYNDRESNLPVDQHMLIALIAPRPVYVSSADEDLWADPRGEFISCVHADPVYELLGVPGVTSPFPTGEVASSRAGEGEADANMLMPPLNQPLMNGRIGYHIRSGTHAYTDYDWNQFLNFAVSKLPSPKN